jgi:hypothetical protein
VCAVRVVRVCVRGVNVSFLQMFPMYIHSLCVCISDVCMYIMLCMYTWRLHLNFQKRMLSGGQLENVYIHVCKCVHVYNACMYVKACTHMYVKGTCIRRYVCMHP